MWQEMMPTGSAEFSVSGQHLRICRTSPPALSQESHMQNEQEQNSNFSLKFEFPASLRAEIHRIDS